MAGKFIKVKSLSGTNIASLDLTNCFNERYNFYEVLTTIKKASGSSATNCSQRFLDSSGSVITASEYNIGYWRVDQYTTVEYATNHTTMNTSDFNGDSVVSIRQSVTNPYASDRYTAGYSSRYTDLASPRERVFYGLAGLKNVQRITGIQTYSSTGNLDIDMAVYGYGES